MSGHLPYGGQAIADLRAARKRPADMVLVSLVGPLREINPVVIAHPEKSYDWRFLAGLEVLLVIETGLDSDLVRRTANAILAVNPDYLGVWFADRQDGLNLAFGSWRPKTKVCRRLGMAERHAMVGIGRATP